MQKELQKMTENEIGNTLISTAVDIHKELGPGLLETVYEIVLEKELQRHGIKVERQVPVEIDYKGIKFREAFRADLIVESKVIVELKCVERINNSHKKQLLTYLRLTGIKLGYLLNFSEVLMKNGITRTINGFV
jgi:GxxExxY protein